MRVIVRQSFRFALIVLLLDLALEVITMELPFSHDLGAWKQKLALHLLIVAAVSICALVGGSVGFYFFPKDRYLSIRQLFWTGASFVAVAFVVGNLLAGGGLSGLLLGLVAIAFIVVQSVGRWIARRDGNSISKESHR
jgi:hypothetical protein